LIFPLVLVIDTLSVVAVLTALAFRIRKLRAEHEEFESETFAKALKELGKWSKK
jgi:hypothetical protein